jgi:hypothetical protein
VLGDRTERATAETAALNRNRESDHLVRGDLLVAVLWMRLPCVRKLVHAVELRRFQRHRRRIQPDVDVAVALYERARVARIRFHVQQTGRMRVQDGIVAHLLEARQADHCLLRLHAARQLVHEPHDLRSRRLRRGAPFRRHRVWVRMRFDRPRQVDVCRIDLQAPVWCPSHEDGAAHVVDRLDRLARREAVRDLGDRTFTVAVHEQVRFRIEQDRTSHALGPVVEVRDAAQARFDAADHDGYVPIRLARTLRIDNHAAVRTFARNAAGCVCVIAADAPVRRVAVHQRIHVATGDAEEEIRSAQSLEIGGTAPIRLRDDADTVAVAFEKAADDRHPEARMIDVRIPGHDDHVAGIPSQEIHFVARHRQHGRRQQPFGPELRVGEESSRR